MRMSARLCSVVSCAVLAGGMSCGYGARVYLLSKSAGEHTRVEVRHFDEDYTAVWEAARKSLHGEYGIYIQKRNEGIIYTKWKSTLKRARGYIHEKKSVLHGLAIEEISEYRSKYDLEEFEIQTRMVFDVMENSGGGTTVIATCVFRIAPAEYYPRELWADRFANKIYSVSEFNVREEWRLLGKIGDILEDPRQGR